MQDFNNYYPQRNYYVFVNGVEGAKSYPIAPNQTMLLMDNNSPMCFMKTTNGLGQSTLRYFKLVEVNEQDVVKTPEDPQIALLTKKVDELYKLLEKEGKKDE